MLQRISMAWAMVLALAGLVLVAALLIFGVELYRAARTGPRWKRRLLSAALAVLSAAGVIGLGPGRADGRGPFPQRPQRPGCYKPMIIRPVDRMAAVRAQLAALEKQFDADKLNPAVLQQLMTNLETAARRLAPCETDSPQARLHAEVKRAIAGARARLEARGKPLAQSLHWQRLDKTWLSAARVAGVGGKPRPLDDKGAKAMLAELDARKRDVAALAGGRLITRVESCLLTRELSRLAAGVRFAPIREVLTMSPDSNAAPGDRAHDSLLRLIDRASLLRTLAESPKLHGPAVEKVLPPIEADLEILAGAKLAAQLSPEERKTAAAVSKVVRAAVDKIRTRLKAGDVTGASKHIAGRGRSV